MISQRSIVSVFQYQMPALAWALFIFTVSTIPATRIPHFISYTDKLVHAGVFGILCWLTHVALHFQPNVKIRKVSLFLAIMLTLLYGATDELHQFHVPGRSMDLFDLLADVCGGMVYVFLYAKFKFYDNKVP